MDHLTRENLARLVDEPPDQQDAAHLALCTDCASELAAFRRQTEELQALPDLRPPRGEWETLESRLRSEGLLRVAPPLEARRSLRSRTAPWHQIAAALVLFVGGTGVGLALAESAPVPFQTASDLGSVRGPGGQAVSRDAGQAVSSGAGRAADLDQAAAAVRMAEEGYMGALARYRELLQAEGGDLEGADPSIRYAALERLVSASRAALREAPADPFLNGFLLSAVAERQATLRGLSQGRPARAGEGWY